MAAVVSEAGRRAAWDAYLAVAEGLLPALRRGDGVGVVSPSLGGVVIRVRRYAPMWPADGAMLIAAACAAVRLLHEGDRDTLTGLAVALAHRLFAMSAGPDRVRHHCPRNQRTAYHLHCATGGQPGGQWRNTRYRTQQHEKGLSDD